MGVKQVNHLVKLFQKILCYSFCMKNNEHVVIVGYGWVGQANALALLEMGFAVSYFDLNDTDRHYKDYLNQYEKITRLSSVLEKDSKNAIYMVCVGDRVSEDGVQDISFIKSALDTLKEAQGTVVLRSTIIPDTLQDLSFDYYVPEFLHEKTAVQECIFPYFVVVGKSNTQKPEPLFISKWRLVTPRHYEGTPREASMIKYLSNLWNSTRIAFVNEFGDMIVSPDSPEAVAKIHEVVDFVLGGEIYQRYGRSYGGHCLPKDTRAFARWYKDKGSGTQLLHGVEESNKSHKLLEESCKDIPEWFSPWPEPHLSGWVALRELIFSVKKNVISPKPFINRYQTKLWWAVIAITLVAIFMVIVF